MVGVEVTSDSLNDEAVAVAQTFAANAAKAITLAKSVDNLGQAGLELAGFSSDDATAFQAAVDYCKTVAQIVTGVAGQADPFDFTNALATFIGPAPVITP